MYSAEVLSQLRTLNWLLEEARRLSPASTERAQIDAQLTALRARLPLSILQYHDIRAGRNLPSIANLQGGNCGHCHATLPHGTVEDLLRPGNFGVCPHCGIFLWAGQSTESGDESATAGPGRQHAKKIRAGRHD